jgi:hypothetical protein
MLKCNECGNEYNMDECVIWEGKVLCVRCALDLYIHMLKSINNKLDLILRRLTLYEYRKEEAN